MGLTLESRFTRARLRQIVAMVLVYAIFYVCRLAFSASKKGMIEVGSYTPTELGYVGSAMLFAYAIGKFVNGFIADRVNAKHFLMTGLSISVAVNLLVGFHLPALVLAAVWFVNGFFRRAVHLVVSSRCRGGGRRTDEGRSMVFGHARTILERCLRMLCRLVWWLQWGVCMDRCGPGRVVFGGHRLSDCWESPLRN